jgi:hypothetical protein
MKYLQSSATVSEKPKPSFAANAPLAILENNVCAAG